MPAIERRRGSLAAIGNAIVLAPAFAWSPASVGPLLVFAGSVTVFAWSEASASEGVDLGAETWRSPALATALTTLAIFVLALITARDAPPALVAAGAGTMLAGVALRRVAMRTLGREFVSEPRAAPVLVQSGVYAHLRHPSETGLLAVGLGAAITLASPWALACWALVAVPLTLARVRAEDRELHACFGPDHESYCRRVRALSPRARATAGGPAQ